MTGFEDSINGDLDRFLTTAPDCYTPYPTALCTACDCYVERVDMKHLDGEEGICFWCWKKGERPEGWDGDE
jgi:hypothetical protein